MGRPVTSASLRADSSAASRSGCCRIVKPPMCSFPSVNGPSVVSVSPPVTLTTVAVLAGCRPAVKTQAPAAVSSSRQACRPAMTGPSTSGGGGSPSGWYRLSRYCCMACPPRCAQARSQGLLPPTRTGSGQIDIGHSCLLTLHYAAATLLPRQLRRCRRGGLNGLVGLIVARLFSAPVAGEGRENHGDHRRSCDRGQAAAERSDDR